MRVVELSREEFAALVELIPAHARSWKDVDGYGVLVLGLVGFRVTTLGEEAVVPVL